MARFSVVIPTYNRSTALRNTVVSVLEQTYTDFEIIVIDDGSTDDSKSVVEALDDSRIRYFWIPNSGGPATPRNKGIDEATAEWVCFLDSDDLWYPNKLEMTNQAIAGNPDVDAVSNDEILHFTVSAKRKLLRYGPFTPHFYREMLIDGNRCSTSAMTVRKAFLDRHGMRFNTSSDYVIVEDYDMWLRMAFHGANFLFIDAPLGEYLIEEGNISGNVARHRKNRMRLLHDHVFRIQNFDADRESLWRKIRAHVMSADAWADLQAFRLSHSLANMIQAIWTSPRAALGYFASRLRRIHEDR
jgi:glycosyltransferase involved in cell wall biosynthesis